MINIFIFVFVMYFLIFFYDFFSLNICLVFNGSWGFVGVGGVGFGSVFVIILLMFVSDFVFVVLLFFVDDSLYFIIIFFLI